MNRMEFYSNLNKYKDIKEFKESPNHDNELKHYGILGQKWGNRRWQNADGTFNTEGKIRYFGSQKAQAEKMQNKTNKDIPTVADKLYPNRKYELNDEDYNKFQEVTYDISSKMEENATNNKGQKFRENQEKLEKELLKVPFVKKHFEEMKKIYQETGDWDKAEEHYWKIPDLAEQGDFLINTIQNHISEDQKLGSAVPIVPLAIGIASGITNYNDVQSLRAGYDDIMSKNPDNYSEADRLAIMNNKKKIAKMEYALDAGDEEKYNKLLNKIKPQEARAAAEKLIKDMNKEALKTKPSEETQQALEDAIEDNKIGSISKPKVNKKYLREDGTLNKEGERKVSSKLKVSDIASSVFKALRNMNIYEAVVGGPLLFAMTMSGFGVPMALGLSLGTIAATSGVAGIDNALYKKLEKRADAYYEMLK